MRCAIFIPIMCNQGWRQGNSLKGVKLTLGVQGAPWWGQGEKPLKLMPF